MGTGRKENKREYFWDRQFLAVIVIRPGEEVVRVDDFVEDNFAVAGNWIGHVAERMYQHFDLSRVCGKLVAQRWHGVFRVNAQTISGFYPQTFPRQALQIRRQLPLTHAHIHRIYCTHKRLIVVIIYQMWFLQFSVNVSLSYAHSAPALSIFGPVFQNTFSRFFHNPKNVTFYFLKWRVMSTRKLCYRKDNRAMRPIHGALNIFGTSRLRPRLLFPTFFMGFCSDPPCKCSFKIWSP